MAVDMFMDIKDVAGESKDDEFKGKIDVLAWSWGMSQSGSFHQGTGGGAGKVNVQDISFTKWVDVSSPVLMLYCYNGKHFEEATLVVRNAGGANPLNYLMITKTTVMVTAVSKKHRAR